MSTRTVTTAAVTTALTLALGMAPAFANDDDVIRQGTCTEGTRWKLKASPQDGRIEVEAEVDSSVNGQVWRWRLLHQGDLSAKGKRTTKPPSGSFEVKRKVVDLKGTDRLTFRAKHRKSGERCVGRVRF